LVPGSESTSDFASGYPCIPSNAPLLAFIVINCLSVKHVGNPLLSRSAPAQQLSMTAMTDRSNLCGTSLAIHIISAALASHGITRFFAAVHKHDPRLRIEAFINIIIIHVGTFT
jgi:hypothetical protein